MSQLGIENTLKQNLNKAWVSGRTALDTVWSKALNRNQVLVSPVFIDEVNKKNTEQNIVNLGEFWPKKRSRIKIMPPTVFGEITLKPTGSLPGVTINNNGSNVDFTLGKTKIVFDQKTGSVSFVGQSGNKKTFSSMIVKDLPFESIEDELKFKSGKPVEIKINSSGSKKLTLFPAKDGTHITKAVVTWPEENKYYDPSLLIFKTAYKENSVTVDNISGAGNLIVTPNQYYVPYARSRTIPFSIPFGSPKAL